ncbi:MAG: methyltransferase domain-containing protein [Bacteroidia bacterium]|nr:methyltransferase domain-containing protein [Bacteroidia bacterium]
MTWTPSYSNVEMDWRLKNQLQRMISRLPGGRTLHGWMQMGSGSLRLTDFFLTDRLQHARRHLDAWHTFRTAPVPEVWELGTGWYPVVPLALRLCGVERVVSLDVYPHLHPVLIRRLATTLISWTRTEQVQAILPAWRTDAIPWLDTLRQHPHPVAWLSAEGVCVRQGRMEKVAPGTIPYLISNNTLEHIPASDLPALIQACTRTLAPGGLMSHYTDHADHYSYTDPRLSPFHFLRYTSAEWEHIESPFQSQNRYRAHQLRSLMEAAGITILSDDRESGESYALDSIPLAEPFVSFAAADNLVLYSHLVGERQGSGPVGQIADKIFPA